MTPSLPIPPPPYLPLSLPALLSRQPSSPSTSGTSVALIVVVVVVVILILSTFLIVLARILLQRRNAANAAPLPPLHLSAQEPHVHRYFPPQPPALIRRQRLAHSAGLSVDELAHVAPVAPFRKRDQEEQTCAVCLDEMHPDTKARRLPCAHAFDAKCIEEWASKANRCPVCNAHIIDEDNLQKARLALIDGRDPSPSPPAIRQRRRRARGENGVFELREASAIDHTPPEDPDNVDVPSTLVVDVR